MHFLGEAYFVKRAQLVMLAAAQLASSSAKNFSPSGCFESGSDFEVVAFVNQDVHVVEQARAGRIKRKHRRPFHECDGYAAVGKSSQGRRCGLDILRFAKLGGEL